MLHAKIKTGKFQIKIECLCEREIKKKVISKIYVLLKNISNNFESKMYSIIIFVITVNISINFFVISNTDPSIIVIKIQLSSSVSSIFYCSRKLGGNISLVLYNGSRGSSWTFVKPFSSQDFDVKSFGSFGSLMCNGFQITTYKRIIYGTTQTLLTKIN